MAIFITDASKVVVQGMTGSEGQKHTTRMLASGTNIVGGVNPRKAGTSVTFPKGDASVDVPVFGTVAEAIDLNVAAPVITASLLERLRSRHRLSNCAISAMLKPRSRERLMKRSVCTAASSYSR